MRRSTLLSMALVGALALTSCGNDPNPNSSTKANYEGTRFAVTKAGQSLDVDGCVVSVHRVTTGNLDSLPDFTLATANCPTATVTTTESLEGKVTRNTILVKPTGPAFDVRNAAAEDATQALKAQAVAARNVRVQELRAEVARLARELQQLEQAPE